MNDIEIMIDIINGEPVERLAKVFSEILMNDIKPINIKFHHYFSILNLK